MKRKLFLPVALLFFTFLLQCKTITTTSIVYRDGSFDRIITITGDSSGIGETAYPFPQNGWTVTQTRHEPSNEDSTVKETVGVFSSSAKGDSGEIEYDYSTQRKLTPGEFNSIFFNVADSIAINIRVQLDKHFRWFYTFYDYQETYHRFFPFMQIPMTDYLTPDEIELYIADTDSSDSIEDKVEEWSQRNIFQAYYQVLLKNKDKLEEQGITFQELENDKESLFELVLDYDFETEPFSAFFLEQAATLWGAPVMALEGEFTSVDSRFTSWYTFMESVIGEDYVNTVMMPGTIIDSNADAVQIDKASWEFGPEYFQFRDYTMQVISRELNTLPVGISIVFVLGVLLLIWMTRQKSRPGQH